MFNWSELKVKGYLFVYLQFRSCVSVKTRAETFSSQPFPKLSLTQHTLIKSAPPTFPSQFNQTVCWYLPRNSICLDLVQSRKTGNLKLDRHGLRLEISIPEIAKNSATPQFNQRLKINWCWEKALRKRKLSQTLEWTFNQYTQIKCQKQQNDWIYSIEPFSSVILLLLIRPP